jgi:hypothetical protein
VAGKKAITVWEIQSIDQDTEISEGSDDRLKVQKVYDYEFGYPTILTKLAFHAQYLGRPRSKCSIS